MHMYFIRSVFVLQFLIFDVFYCLVSGVFFTVCTCYVLPLGVIIINKKIGKSTNATSIHSIKFTTFSTWSFVIRTLSKIALSLLLTGEL